MESSDREAMAYGIGGVEQREGLDKQRRWLDGGGGGYRVMLEERGERTVIGLCIEERKRMEGMMRMKVWWR